ncbi:MAG TPA: hypothetical protein VH309_09830 [Elusimicrobiota bacterium]|jgi:hypothetical protein|nr:hypothetical protein [Elusimicrobiota bacterium]
MLREFKKVSQPRETPGYRRWFSDEDMELIVWYSPAGAIRGFQLCYDRNGRERAFTWHVDAGMVHTAVDEGEDSPLRNDAPILVPDGVPRTDRVLADFKRRSRGLEPALVSLVTDRLEAFRRPR